MTRACDRDSVCGGRRNRLIPTLSNHLGSLLEEEKHKPITGETKIH
jgi:hypothetical protein